LPDAQVRVVTRAAVRMVAERGFALFVRDFEAAARP
jgi:hypothetical protein